MQQDAAEQAQRQQAAYDGHVKETATPSSTDQLTTLAELRDNGTITAAEFQSQKAMVLS